MSDTTSVTIRTVTLDAGRRSVLAAVADVLIPAAAPMPSASEAGVPDQLIDRVLGYRPDLVTPFTQALDACAGQDPATAIDTIASTSPEQFQALTLLISGAYFQSPATKAALDYEPAPRTLRDDVDAYVDLLANVVERGFTIR